MPTPAKPFDTEAFLEFCRGKPRGEAYDGTSPRTCALAQFGFPAALLVGDKVIPEAAGISLAAYDAAIGRPHTFGALSDRLASLVTEG